MVRIAASCLGASLLFLTASAPTAAAPAPITGKLSSPGYTVIGLAANGEARTVTASTTGFSFVPPADPVTLHLRAPNGTYAGPIVLADPTDNVTPARANVRKAKRALRRAKRRLRAARRSVAQASGDRDRQRAERRLKRAKAKRRRAARRLRRAKRALEVARQEAAQRPNSAVVGVRGGAALGEISVGAGYALAREIPEAVWRTSIDSESKARATGGAPLGAGNFGFVASPPAAGSLAGDLDLDAVPDRIDIDDDGDLILDELDSTPVGGGAAAAQAPGCGPADIYCPPVSSGLALFLEQSVNANAGSSSAQINSAMASHGVLRFDVGPSGLGGRTGAVVELDCGNPDTGLVYCRQNGSTATASAGAPGGPAFPGPPGGTFDADADGFGLLDPALEPFACSPCPTNFFVLHGATAQQIGSGDVLLEHIASSGDPSQCPPPSGQTSDACVPIPATIQYVFATTVALIAYGDTAGNSATVSYPVPSSGPGTFEHGFPVAPGPNGDVVLTLSFWRPQRRAIPESDPAGAAWMDVGHLTYGVKLAGGGFCPQAAFSEEDPDLTVATPHVFLEGGGGVDDQHPDEASSPGDVSPERTFTYSLNLSQCLASHGIAFGAGDEAELEFIGAPGAPSGVSQTVYFKRQ